MMSERERCLRRLSAIQFSLWELHLYLDTHPTSAEAAEACCKYSKQFEDAKREYEEKFGPLSPPTCKNTSEWLNQPFPWEYNSEEE